MGAVRTAADVPLAVSGDMDAIQRLGDVGKGAARSIGQAFSGDPEAGGEAIGQLGTMLIAPRVFNGVRYTASLPGKIAGGVKAAGKAAGRVNPDLVTLASPRVQAGINLSKKMSEIARGEGSLKDLVITPETPVKPSATVAPPKPVPVSTAPTTQAPAPPVEPPTPAAAPAPKVAPWDPSKIRAEELAWRQKMSLTKGSATVEPPTAAPAIDTHPAPTTQAPAPKSSMSPQRILNELAIQGKRQSVQLSEADYTAASEAMKQGQSAADVVAQFKAGQTPKPKMTVSESKWYLDMRANGLTHLEAVEALQAAKAMRDRFGLPSSEMVVSKVKSRNETGRW